jgi:hypothetical protein
MFMGIHALQERKYTERLSRDAASLEPRILYMMTRT